MKIRTLRAWSVTLISLSCLFAFAAQAAAKESPATTTLAVTSALISL